MSGRCAEGSYASDQHVKAALEERGFEASSANGNAGLGQLFADRAAGEEAMQNYPHSGYED